MSSTKKWDYEPIEYHNQDIEINGYPMYAETISGSEPFIRREWTEKTIMNGTTVVSKGQFVPRQYTFKTTLFVTPEKVDVHDKILRSMTIEPAEITCPAMGEPFKAMVSLKKDYEGATPYSVNVDFTIKEIPNVTSDITQSNIYEGTESSMSIEEYTEENQNIVEETLNKGTVDKTQGKNENTDTESIKVEVGETQDGIGTGKTNSTNINDININTKN